MSLAEGRKPNEQGEHDLGGAPKPPEKQWYNVKVTKGEAKDHEGQKFFSFGFEVADGEWAGYDKLEYSVWSTNKGAEETMATVLTTLDIYDEVVQGAGPGANSFFEDNVLNQIQIAVQKNPIMSVYVAKNAKGYLNVYRLKHASDDAYATQAEQTLG